LPAAYLSVHVEGSFDISVYVDINGQWVSGDRRARIEWEYITTDVIAKKADELKTWMIKKQEESLFTEWADRAEWGRLYFSGPSVSLASIQGDSNSPGR
jgi:beta-galactosidase/beta-glucuronidase